MIVDAVCLETGGVDGVGAEGAVSLAAPFVLMTPASQADFAVGVSQAESGVKVVVERKSLTETDEALKLLQTQQQPQQLQLQPLFPCPVCLVEYTEPKLVEHMAVHPVCEVCQVSCRLIQDKNSLVFCFCFMRMIFL